MKYFAEAFAFRHPSCDRRINILAGAVRSIKAKISDQAFLSRFHSGQVRFYQNDIIKARVKTEQTLKNGKTTQKHEILEVLAYDPAPIQTTTG